MAKKAKMTKVPKKRNPQDATIGRNIGAIKRRFGVVDSKLDLLEADLTSLEIKVDRLGARVQTLEVATGKPIPTPPQGPVD